MPLKTQQKPPQDETAVTRTCLGSELMIYLRKPPASRVEAQQSGARLLNAGQEQLLWCVGGRPQDLGQCKGWIWTSHRGGLSSTQEAYLGEICSR